MGYEVSLRHSEADMIEVISVEEAERIEKENKQNKSNNPSDIYDEAANNASVEDKSAPNPTPLTEGQLRDAAMKKRRTINVALVGNPNCGKTSLFNFASGAHERVGNYSGVTVDAKVGHAEFEGYEFNIVDLPGTYSLSAYSPEELYVRKQIIENTPDVIINVIDTSNLERNLYLTTQLIDMHLRMVCALNMFDETEKRGDNVDYAKLGELFGVPMIPTTFTTGRGVELLFHIIINMYEGLDFLDANGNLDPEVAEGIKQWHEQYSKSEKEQPDHDEDFASGVKPKHNVFRHIHINHGTYIEEGITAIQAELKKENDLRHKFSTRYLAIKLLERDSDTEQLIKSSTSHPDRILAVRDKATADVQTYTHEDSETAIMDAKYGFIHGALQEAGYQTGNKKDTYQVTHLIDNVITNKYVGFPIFILMIWVMFETTFSLGQYPMNWIEAGVEWIGSMISEHMTAGPLKDMLIDGVIGGVGSVIVFLPQILILYFFISFMEDSGYMARAAFIHGQANAQDGTARQVVHPAHHGLWMQRASRNGNTHYREPTLTPYYNAHPATHELLGTLPYIHYDYRNHVCSAISLCHHDVAISCGHRHGCHNEPTVQQDSVQRRGHSVCYGTSTLPIPYSQGHWSTYMAEG